MPPTIINQMTGRKRRKPLRDLHRRVRRGFRGDGHAAAGGQRAAAALHHRRFDDLDRAIGPVPASTAGVREEMEEGVNDIEVEGMKRARRAARDYGSLADSHA